MKNDEGDQKFPKLIKSLRKQKGLTQQQLALMSGVAQPSINYIERGKSKPENIRFSTLTGLAHAFEIEIGAFARTVASITTENEKGEQQVIWRGADSIAPQTRTSLLVRDRPADPTALYQQGTTASAEKLVAQGEILYAKQDWQQALTDYYLPALDLLQDPVEKIHLMIDRLAPAYGTLCDFESSDRVIDKANEIYQRLCKEQGLEQDPEIHSSITQIKGYNAIHRGDFKATQDHYLSARSAAQELGARKLEASSYHFVGRMIIENSTFLFFPALFKSRSNPASIELALKYLDISESIHTAIENKPAASFDGIWLARGLLLRGNHQGARDLLQHSLQFFEETGTKSGMGHAFLGLARMSLLLDDNEYSVRDTKRQLRAILAGQLADTQHPYIVARMFVLIAYCDLLLGKYRFDPRMRRLAVDACNFVIKVYPYPQHPLTKIARLLREYFINAMDVQELIEYDRLLEYRMQEERGEVFQFLHNFHLSHAQQIRNLK